MVDVEIGTARFYVHLDQSNLGQMVEICAIAAKVRWGHS